ncbi:hypothetical protein LUZ61_000851 [Rhynchospora tenuis]|uniref:Uncharacterized protein n=1 Tax=Rhynchospora tenuis TaxID=198213 RepID=A0AAD5ZG52_9POAL|nr:hypothetical protein LUZ61_000851 [Rhynchospora tenuis]
MAHPAKFVPVNLNKSYGRNSSLSAGGGAPASAGGPHAHAHAHAPRYGRHGGNSGGGGGMVVLSRPKAAPKLSVPPPLNLPSMKKEHEKFDSNGSGSIPGRQGLGHGPGSSTMGWTKPAVLKDSSVPDPGAGSRPGGPSAPASTSQGFTEKAVILKGEDFPTLRAATYTPPSKQRDGSNRIEKKKVNGEEGSERRPLSPILMDMRPQMRPPRSGSGNSADRRDGAGLEKQRKVDEPLSGPLPIMRVDYKSDWEDDERNTGLSLPERERVGNAKHEPSLNRDFYDTNTRDFEPKEVYRGDAFGKDAAYFNKDNRDNPWRPHAANQRGDRYGPHESDRNNDTRPYSAGRGNNTQSWHSKRDPGTQTYNYMGGEEHSTGWHRGSSYQNNSGPKAYVSPLSSNKGLMASDVVLNISREKRTTLGPAKPVAYLEDVDDIGEVNVKALKKKKELQKPTEFHDPVRESFEAELDKILRMQEMERQRAMEERARALEMARREEEERERTVREERERLAKEEEEARRAAWLAEQEKIEAARRAEEQRLAREEEKRRMLSEEERRKDAARQKLLELEAKIARRQAEAHSQGENNSNTAIRLEPKDAPIAGVNFGDREDGERQAERLNTGSSDSSSMNRYFDTGISSGNASRWSNMRDGVSNESSSLLDRGESHQYYGTRNPFQDQEYAYRSPGIGMGTTRRDVLGPGPVRRSYSRKDQQPYDSMRVQRWENNPGFNRPQPDFESEYLEGDRLGDAGWGSPSNSVGSPHAQYDTSGSFSSFTRYRYGSRQPRVPPPPAVTSMYRGPIADRTGPSSSSTTGRDGVHSMGTSYVDAYQESSQLHMTEPSLVERDASLVASTTNHLEQSEEKASGRCGSQSSLSVSSPPVSPPHVSHDEMDVSGDLPAPPTSAETPQSYNENGEIDRPSDLSDAITDVEDEEWGPEENAEEMNHPDDYEGEEEERDVVGVNEGVDSNLDLQQDFGDVAGDTEQIILGFDEGVQVPIPRNSSEFESQKAVEMDSGPNALVKEPINTLVEESTMLGETEKALRDLSLDQMMKSVASPLMPSQDKLANVSGLPTPIVPPVKPIMPPSSTQAVSSQAEVPLNLQFGLFSGPSLIPTPIPAIQIGSIQMPIHLHTQMSPSIPQMHPSSAPLFQFGQLRYASSVVSQGITPLATQAIQSFVRPAGPSNPYMVNQNQTSTNATLQSKPESQVTLSQKNITDASQLSMPANSQNKESEKSKDITSLIPSGNKELQVQLQSSSTETRVSNGSKGPMIVSTGARGRRYGSYNTNNPPRESNMRFVPVGSETSRKDLRGGYRRPRRNIRRTELRVRENGERREKPVSDLSYQERTDERNGENVNAASVAGGRDNTRHKDDVLESGVVRVFEQPGIEVPSDADGFIEVRSKKQMLNDRRVKREREKEKEIRPKPRMQKVSRKQNTGAVVRSVAPNFNKTTKEVIESTGKSLSKVQPSVPLSGSSTSKSLPPIGTPSQKLPESDPASSSLKTSQPSNIGTGLLFEGTTVAEKPLALGSWESSHSDQQVMPLTQSQLEEAMRPVQFEQQSSTKSFSLEPSKPIISAQEKPSPINSLLAGEKIQFGVVTSSPIIPVNRPAAPNGLGAPGSSRPVAPTKKELPPIHLFDKGKATAQEPVIVSMEEEDEDEAEAAASAVAVAAISNDEVASCTVVNSSVIPEQKNISSSDAPGLAPGEPTGQDAPSQSTATEESSSLTVALPADLSVDTPSITMWPPLPSPQSTGPNPMFSQFPGTQPSHYNSCFDVNPMLGGAHHIFSFGPHDETAAQSHAQRTAAGGPLGSWPGPHPSGVDSFYRPPAGYGSPFIGPGGIQGPPHMVVYNHFTPVGQFGQVGLSFVGPATYIPTEKHPEWKQLAHTHSVAPVGQGDVNCQNLGPGPVVSQGTAGPGQGQIQHLRPTSPLMQMPVFDMSPFQPTGEMPMQACWPHMPPGPPPLHSGPPLQQQQIDIQLGHNHQNQPAHNGPHFHEPPAALHSDNRRAPQFPNELGLVDRSVSTNGAVGVQPVLPSLASNDEGSCAKPGLKPALANAIVSLSEKSPAASGTATAAVAGGGVSNTAATVKGQHATVIDRRGKNEWHRRGGYSHGRKQGSGQDKLFGTGTGRMKQIYVAKASVTGSASTPTTATNS